MLFANVSIQTGTFFLTDKDFLKGQGKWATLIAGYAAAFSAFITSRPC